MTTAAQSTPTDSTKPNIKWWAPRFWLGSDFFGFMRLLRRNRFNVGWKHIHVAAFDALLSVGHTTLGGVQQATLGRKIQETEVEQPLFVLGHWRSGTTLLHELLMLDSNHAYPTTWQCFVPHHFLLSEWVAQRTLGIFMPPQRPMDNMALGWDRPQEDEFALANMGLPSPYLTIAFPNHPPQYKQYLDMEGLSREEIEQWQQGLMLFLKQVQYKNPGKRLVLKSPPHTCRIKVLLEMFPQARFVYLVRNPFMVYASTVHLWKSLYTAHGLQTPNYEGIEEYVLETFERMHRQYEATRHLVPEGHLVEMKYEDLVSDTEGQMERLYHGLSLGDFETVRPALRKYLEEIADYQTNKYRPIPEETRQLIVNRWGDFLERHGYSPEPSAA